MYREGAQNPSPEGKHVSVTGREERVGWDSWLHRSGEWGLPQHPWGWNLAGGEWRVDTMLEGDSLPEKSRSSDLTVFPLMCWYLLQQGLGIAGSAALLIWD